MTFLTKILQKRVVRHRKTLEQKLADAPAAPGKPTDPISPVLPADPADPLLPV